VQARANTSRPLSGITVLDPDLPAALAAASWVVRGESEQRAVVAVAPATPGSCPVTWPSASAFDSRDLAHLVLDDLYAVGWLTRVTAGTCTVAPSGGPTNLPGDSRGAGRSMGQTLGWCRGHHRCRSR
jgi:hypothetical protein